MPIQLIEDLCTTLPEVKEDVAILRSCLTTVLTEIDQAYNDCDMKAATVRLPLECVAPYARIAEQGRA